jgi:predicted Zn-dependent peptidase
MNQIKYGSLNTSIKYILCKTKSNNDISVQIRISAGSRDETSGIHGISHVLEHMFFQGSEKYPTQFELESEIYNCGGAFNAYTNKDSTVYHIDGSKKCLEKFLEIMSDSFYNSLFDEKKLENEKKVVTNEINDHLSDPSNLSWYGIDALHFKNTRLEKNVPGSEKSVQSLTSEKLKNYINTYYQKNIILSVGGNINFEKTLNLLKKYFTKKPNYPVKELKSITNDRERILYSQLHQKKVNIKYIKRPDEQSFITMSFPSFKYSSKHTYTTSLISEILTGYMSSRLYDILRNKEGLIYHIVTGDTNYQDIGVFYIHFSVKNKKENILKSIHIIYDVVESLPDLIDDKEIQRCKNNLIENLKSNKNNPHWMCDNSSSELFYSKKINPIEKDIDNFKKITVEEIKKISGVIFQKKLSNISYTAKMKCF